MPKKGKHGKGDIKLRTIECKCPMCKKLHKQSIPWKHSTRPWIYCKLCQPKVASRASHVRPVTSHYPAMHTGHFE